MGRRLSIGGVSVCMMGLCCCFSICFFALDSGGPPFNSSVESMQRQPTNKLAYPEGCNNGGGSRSNTFGDSSRYINHPSTKLGTVADCSVRPIPDNLASRPAVQDLPTAYHLGMCTPRIHRDCF
eukprot:GHVT01047872.1.p1 GENE.GHVT01047872.1~~GHVT01047872.1.p1  ORF type:complete len:124 (-),score=9.44 GHVT01047872.1:654-1025(-)